MLVITRKAKERIVINDQISVVVLETDGQRVKLGVEAPKEVSIYRQEVYEAIQEENRLAAQQLSEKPLWEQWMSQFLKKNPKERGWRHD